MQYRYFLGLLICWFLNVQAGIQNIYDTQGFLVASCEENNGCRYIAYKGLSQAGEVEQGDYKKYISGLNGKIAMVKMSNEPSRDPIWLATNFQGTVVATVTEDNTTQNLFDAFGNQPSATTNTDSEVDTIYADKHAIEKGVYNNNARFLGAFEGRFFSPDPLVNINWYTYARNNPLSFTDPDGRQESKIVQQGQPTKGKWLDDDNENRKFIGYKFAASESPDDDFIKVAYEPETKKFVVVKVQSKNGLGGKLFATAHDTVLKNNRLKSFSMIDGTDLNEKHADLYFNVPKGNRRRTNGPEVILRSPIAKAMEERGYEPSFDIRRADGRVKLIGMPHIYRKQGGQAGVEAALTQFAVVCTAYCVDRYLERHYDPYGEPWPETVTPAQLGHETAIHGED